MIWRKKKTNHMIVRKELQCGSLYIQESETGLWIDFNPKGANGLVPVVGIEDRGDSIGLVATDLDGNERELVYPIEKARQKGM